MAHISRQQASQQLPQISQEMRGGSPGTFWLSPSVPWLHSASPSLQRQPGGDGCSPPSAAGAWEAARVESVRNSSRPVLGIYVFALSVVSFSFFFFISGWPGLGFLL